MADENVKPGGRSGIWSIGIEKPRRWALPVIGGALLTLCGMLFGAGVAFQTREGALADHEKRLTALEEHQRTMMVVNERLARIEATLEAINRRTTRP